MLKRYQFKNEELLARSLRHKSHAHEVDAADNERLEFLGDSILSMIVSEQLYKLFPKEQEGVLSKLRAALVSERNLTTLSKNLGIASLVKLGAGEESTGGREKSSILSSTLEALVAAIYLDGGFEATKVWVNELFHEQLSSVAAGNDRDFLEARDFKTTLQEVCQEKLKQTPRYEVLTSSGPDHARTFEVRALIQGVALSKAKGLSKKSAEQAAAQAALELIEQKGGFDAFWEKHLDAKSNGASSDK